MDFTSSSRPVLTLGHSPATNYKSPEGAIYENFPCMKMIKLGIYSWRGRVSPEFEVNKGESPEWRDPVSCELSIILLLSATYDGSPR